MTVNGTKDVVLEWDAINWRLHEDNVRRLRHRIFKAVQEQDLTKARSLPVLMDRCHQARTKNALEPEWEARFEPRSYGFRPARSCQDAIEAIYDTRKGHSATRLWILDANLTAAGTPQGGVISPLLLNVALHGLETAAGVRYAADGIRTAKISPVLIRYCDDFVVCCHTRQQAEQVHAQLARWLAPRGLAFNNDKTTIVALETGYDFLGFTIRRYRNGKLLIKPSAAAVRRVKHTLATEMRSLRGHNASTVLATINPIVRGWASFYRAVVSKKTFTDVDDYLWKLTYKWAGLFSELEIGRSR